MNDRLLQLALFVRTVESGSFSRAAREFGLSQPSVSRAIAALERRLGVKLLIRTTRQVSATDAGEALLAHARDALLAIDEAESAARGADHLSGVLRVALPPEYGVRRIVPLLPAFFARHPLLKIDLMMSDRYENLIAEGADLALRIGDLPDSSFVARKLDSARRLFIAAPSYLAGRGAPMSLADLARPRPHQRSGGPWRRDLGRAPQRTDRAPGGEPARPVAVGDRRRRLRRRGPRRRDRVDLDVRGRARLRRGGRDPHRLCARSGPGLRRFSRRPPAIAEGARLQRLSRAGSCRDRGRKRPSRDPEQTAAISSRSAPPQPLRKA